MGGLDHRPGGIEGDRADGRFVLAEKSRVNFDRAGVFGGNVDVFEYRVHRADDLALLAIDADFRVDVELRRARLGVDARDRTNFDAGAVVGTKFGDDVGHGILASLGNEKLKMQNSKC